MGAMVCIGQRRRRKRRGRRRGVVLQWREVRGDCSLCLWERSDYVTTALRNCNPNTY